MTEGDSDHTTHDGQGQVDENDEGLAVARKGEEQEPVHGQQHDPRKHRNDGKAAGGALELTTEDQTVAGRQVELLIEGAASRLHGAGQIATGDVGGQHRDPPDVFSTHDARAQVLAQPGDVGEADRLPIRGEDRQIPELFAVTGGTARDTHHHRGDETVLEDLPYLGALKERLDRTRKPRSVEPVTRHRDAVKINRDLWHRGLLLVGQIDDARNAAENPLGCRCQTAEY